MNYKKYLLVVTLLMNTACATNRIHFSSYTGNEEIKTIEMIKVTDGAATITYPTPCTRCGESGNFVWHAASLQGGRLLEGFRSIPINDIGEFSSKALGVSESNNDNIIRIKRIFLKTWGKPQYYAAEVNVDVTRSGITMGGSSIVKIKGVGQNLLGYKSVVLDKNAFDAITLAIKSAYIKASNRFES